MKKLITLLIVLGMVFAASQALAWTWNTWETVEGGAEQHNAYQVGGNPTGAGGWNYSAGEYNAQGPELVGGYAETDGQTQALKGYSAMVIIDGMGGYGINGTYRAAGAYGQNSSESYAFGMCDANTYVYGEGMVGHNTQLNGSSGGSTYGMATWDYEQDGNTCGYSYASGEGFGASGGVTWRNSISNGMSSHSRSFSVAGSHTD